MPLRAIIFDHDGTLVDSYEGIARCMQLTCRDLHKPEMTEKDILDSIGPSLEQRFAELWGEEEAAEGARIYRAHYERHFLSGSRLIAGVRETLETVESKGLAMACVTNKTWEYCIRQLEHFGLLGKMKAVYGNKQGFPPKPDPAMVFAALETLGVEAGDAVVVGDTTIDVATARAAGLPAWIVKSRYTKWNEMKKMRPDEILECFPDLLPLLESPAPGSLP